MFIGIFYRQFDVLIEFVVFFLFFHGFFFKHKKSSSGFHMVKTVFFGTTTIQSHNLLKISSRQLMAYCGSSD